MSESVNSKKRALSPGDKNPSSFNQQEASGCMNCVMLQDRLDELERRIDARLNAACARLSEEKDRLSEEKDRLSATWDRLGEEHGRINATCDRLSEENVGFRADMADSCAKTADLTDQIHRVRDRLLLRDWVKDIDKDLAKFVRGDTMDPEGAVFVSQLKKKLRSMPAAAAERYRSPRR